MTYDEQTYRYLYKKGALFCKVWKKKHFCQEKMPLVGVWGPWSRNMFLLSALQNLVHLTV